MKYFLVHDLGTTSDKAALFDTSGRLAASVQSAYDTVDTGDGGFEQNPADWLKAVSNSTRMVVEKAGIGAGQIEGISLSGHMMGVVALDDKGLPVRPAILHSDTRSAAQARDAAVRIDPARVHQIGGNPLDVHYPWLKIAWLKASEPGSYSQTSVVVQSKDHVAAWLTGSRPVTDVSDASLYGCFGFDEMRWSAELCEAAGIDICKLPDVVQAGTMLGGLSGTASAALGLAEGTPVYAGFGDGASAAMGSGSASAGSCYCYVGSTAWVSQTTSDCSIDPQGKLFTLALLNNKFAQLGTVQSAGSAWEWAVTRLCEAHFETAESLASSAAAGSGGLVFLPYLTGERAPIWDSDARGVWFGLSSAHGDAEMLRSVLEGVSLCLASVMDELARVTPYCPGHVQVIGGGVRSRLWTSILASAFRLECRLLAEAGEATARGAMMAAAVGSGACSSFEDASERMVPPHSLVQPVQPDADIYKRLRPLMSDLYSSTRHIYPMLKSFRSAGSATGGSDNAAV